MTKSDPPGNAPSSGGEAPVPASRISATTKHLIDTGALGRLAGLQYKPLIDTGALGPSHSISGLVESLVSASHRQSLASDALKAMAGVQFSPPSVTPSIRSPLQPVPQTVVLPAQSTRTLARRRWQKWLRLSVDQLSERLRQRHEGAWDAIGHSGPDSISQAASSLVGFINGVLRESAPRLEVLEWLDQMGKPEWGYVSEERPTHRARAHFLLSKQGVPERTSKAYSLALSEITRDLQEVKHGRENRSTCLVECALLFFEALLVLVSQHDQSELIDP